MEKPQFILRCLLALIAPILLVSDGHGQVTFVYQGSTVGTPQGLANFITDPAPFVTYTVNLTQATVAGVLGSAGTPDTTTNFTAAFQKIGQQSASASLGGAIFGSTVLTAGTGHNIGIYGVASSAVTGTAPNSFLEGVDGTCKLLSGSTNTACGGATGTTEIWTTSYGAAVGVEGADNNQSGVDAGLIINSGQFDTGVMASCGTHGAISGTAKCQFAFLVNPDSPASFHYGFYVPAGSPSVGGVGLVVDTAAFRNDSIAAYGLDLEGINSVLQIKAHGFTVSPTGDVIAANATVTGTINTSAYQAGGTPGVTCVPGLPTSSFQVSAGIVIHC